MEKPEQTFWPTPCNTWASQVVLVVKNPLSMQVDVRDTGSIPGLGRSPRERHDNPLQYSYLENPTDREAWQAVVQMVAQSQTQLKQLSIEQHSC